MFEILICVFWILIISIFYLFIYRLNIWNLSKFILKSWIWFYFIFLNIVLKVWKSEKEGEIAVVNVREWRRQMIGRGRRYGWRRKGGRWSVGSGTGGVMVIVFGPARDGNVVFDWVPPPPCCECDSHLFLYDGH